MIKNKRKKEGGNEKKKNSSFGVHVHPIPFSIQVRFFK